MIGRSAETKYLEEIFKGEGNQLVILHGRKGVGKTELVLDFCKNKKYVYYSSREASKELQKKILGSEIEQKYGITLKSYEYDNLFTKIRSNDPSRLVVVIDEFQNIVKKDEDFCLSLEKLIRKQLYPGPVMIVLISSDLVWVQSNMYDQIRPIFKYLSGKMKVDEVRFIDSQKFFQNYTLRQSMEAYGILGGVPAYMNVWNSGIGVKENICKHILQEKGNLHEEATHFMSAQLRELSIYNTILYGIASGKHKLNQLYQETGFSRAKISVYLKNLMEFDVIEKVKSFETPGKVNALKGVYEIKNSYLNFWFRFIYPNLSALKQLSPEEFFTQFIQENLSDYMSRYFRKICFEYFELENHKNTLPIQYEKIGSWVGKEGDIDLIAKDKAGKTLIGLCNWSEEKLTYSMCEKLFRTMEKAKINADFYYLFSVSGFEEKLYEDVKNDKRIQCIDLEKFSSLLVNDATNDKSGV